MKSGTGLAGLGCGGVFVLIFDDAVAQGPSLRSLADESQSYRPRVILLFIICFALFLSLSFYSINFDATLV